MRFSYDTISTPLGAMTMAVDEEGALRVLDWAQAGRDDLFSFQRFYKDVTLEKRPAPKPIKKALNQYFEGELTAIESIKIALPGTEFQRAVWNALCQIPAGTTCSYGDIARTINNEKAVRAVGMANNANPIAVVVPCHRVIGASGKMVGYGSGVKRKEWLLKHEKGDGGQRELLI